MYDPDFESMVPRLEEVILVHDEVPVRIAGRRRIRGVVFGYGQTVHDVHDRKRPRDLVMEYTINCSSRNSYCAVSIYVTALQVERHIPLNRKIAEAPALVV